MESIQDGTTWSQKTEGSTSQLEEFRNEKDGFPFIEDLPPELSGPLSGALNPRAQYKR